MPVQSTVWESGAMSPLRAQHTVIASCAKEAGLSAGVFVVALEFAGGDVKLAFENAPPALASCLAKMKVQRPPGEPNKERCGVAFGTWALDQLPPIAITATDVAFGGKPVARITDLTNDTAADQLPALTAALAAWAKSQSSAIAIRGVGMIEPSPATPMKLVYRALRSTYAAEVELVLATQRGATWQPLRELVVPVEPIAVGTGGSWNDAHRGTLAGGVADLRPHLSVYVQGERIWVGQSGVFQFQEVPGRDWKKLEAILREHKRDPAFAARSDIEIAADEAIPYSEVVHAIELAGTVGFKDWRVMGPGELSAAPSL
jgi:hypothetical protein